MLAANAPYKFARLASLFLTFVFGVVGFALGINALVKSNDQKDLVKGQASALGATVNIDTGDVFKVGCVVTAVCAALAVVSLISLVLLLFSGSASKSTAPLSTRTLPLQALIFSFLTVWLFASLVAMTDFVANREAKVSASIGGNPVPDSLIKAVEQGLGVTSVYRHIDYLRIAVILPWIAFLFGAISSVLSFVASRRARRASATAATGPTTIPAERASSVKEKGDTNVEQTQV